MSPEPSHAPKAQPTLGQRGEALAADFLTRRGYQVLARNWRCKRGEIDLIVEQQTMLIFVEVRSRSMTTTERAFESIGPRKRTRLVAAAQFYLSATHQDHRPWRIDIIAVAFPHGREPIVEHVEDALDW